MVGSAAPGQPARFGLRVERGQFVALSVEQTGLDVVVTVRAPGGETWLVEDNLFERRRPERLAFVAEESGAFELLVGAFGDQSGPFTLLVAAPPGLASDSKRELALALRERWQGAGSGCSGRSHAEALGRARDRFRRLGETLREAETLKLLGQCLRALPAAERPAGETASGNLEQAIELFRHPEARDRATEAELSNDLGVEWLRAGRSDQAELAFTTARQVSLEETLAGTFQASMVNLLKLRRQQGDLQGARDLGLELERWAELRGDGAARLAAWDGLGMIAFDLGDLLEAEARAEELLTLARQRQDPVAAAHAWAIRARVSWKRGRQEEALQEIDQAESLGGASRGGAELDRADRLNLRALVLSELGRHTAALADLAAARALYQGAAEQGELAMNTFNRGVFLERAGQPQEGLAACEQATAEFRALGRATHEASAWFCRALALIALDRFEEAETAAKTAIDGVESVRARLLAPTTKSSYQESKRRFYDLYVELLMRDQAGPGRRDEEALAVSDLARSRLLVESLGEIRDGLRERVDPQLRRRWDELRKQALVSTTTPSVPDGWSLLERQALRLEEDLRRGSRAFAALTNPPRTGRARLQSSLLPAATELLYLHLGDRQSYLWRVSRDHFESFALGPSAPLREAAKAAGEDLARSDDPERLAAAARRLSGLSETLLGPLGERPLARRLWVAADGELVFLPFGLLTRPRGGELLLEHHEIVMLPSLSVLEVLVALKEERPSARRTIAVVGHPVLEAPAAPSPPAPGAGAPSGVATVREESRIFPPLPYARREIEAILERAPAGQALRISGLDANRQHLLSGVLSDFRIVHFATHGSLDSERPQRSRIVLSQVDRAGQRVDQSLRLADLYSLELSADLVVAGTCKSARGSAFGGDGLSTFTRGFFYAGALSVIVSLWSVDDEATFVLMDRFYEHHLSRGLSAAAALRLAQLEVRAEPRWRAPIYWAAFTLHGAPP